MIEAQVLNNNVLPCNFLTQQQQRELSWFKETTNKRILRRVVLWRWETGIRQVSRRTITWLPSRLRYQKPTPDDAQWLDDWKPTETVTRVHHGRVKRRLSCDFCEICKIMVKDEKIGANWISLSPWNTNSCESRSLHAMGAEWKPNSGSLVIFFCCIYFNKYSNSLKEGTSIDHPLCTRHFVHHFSWVSPFTCEVGILLLIFRWDTWSLGRLLPAHREAGSGEGWYWSPVSASRPAAFSQPQPKRPTVELRHNWAPKPCSRWFWPGAAQLALRSSPRHTQS